jgi:diguanylate cyclase (GGDEF)-like protein
MGAVPLKINHSWTRPLLAHTGGLFIIFLAASWLRMLSIASDPILQGYLQVTSGLLAFVFAAVALVRFQGEQDRISLILGSGFLLCGAVLTASSVFFFQFLQEKPLHMLWAPVAWWLSRMVLALLFLVALLVEHFLPRSRHPREEIAGALLAVVGLTYLFTAALRRLPADVSSHPGAIIPNPQQILPAVIFLIAMVWFRRRLHGEGSAFDRAIYAAAWLNVAAQLAACQSERLLDAPFVLAEALKASSFAVALGGALLENARLFEQVRHLAISDPLTGLANYRKLLEVLEYETERTNRNGRTFSILLLDLDGLKKINDTHGHVVGSRAICRVAEILRATCRSIDVAARYGGDEFALVLPETGIEEARRVASRIRKGLLADAEEPALSASIGISVYSGHGERIEKLLSEADRELYEEKTRRKGRAGSAVPLRRPRKA